MSKEAPMVHETLKSKGNSPRNISPILFSCLIPTSNELIMEDENQSRNGSEPKRLNSPTTNIVRCVLCCDLCSSWNINSEIKMQYLFTLAGLISDSSTDLGEGLFRFSYCEKCQQSISSLYRHIFKISKLEAKIKFLKSEISSAITEKTTQDVNKMTSDFQQFNSVELEDFASFRNQLRECITEIPSVGRKPTDYDHQKRLKICTSRVEYVTEVKSENCLEAEEDRSSNLCDSSLDPMPISDNNSNFLESKDSFFIKKSLRTNMTNAGKRIKCVHGSCLETFGKQRTMLMHLKKYHKGVENPFKCNICPKSYINPKRLIEHKQTHDGPDFVCEVCGKTVKGTTSLRKHKWWHKNVNKVRKVKREFKCEQCPKVYRTKQSLQSHCIIVHAQNFPFYCEICGIGCINKNLLKYHIGHHYDDDPLKCKDCGKTYETPKDLRYHRQEHTGQYSLHCELCDKGMATPTLLKRHMDMHYDRRDYKCDLCQKGFRSKQQMTRHRNIHTNYRQHLCDVCGKGFYCNTTLKAHQRIHTGEQPHQCHICFKRFTHDHYIKKHLAYHEKAERKGKKLRKQQNFHRKNALARSTSTSIEHSNISCIKSDSDLEQ